MPNYTDSAPRALNEKLGEIPSTLDFVSVGDGITDDTAALQSAINSTAARGVTLLLPVGTYLASALTLPSNCRIKGELGAVIKQADDAAVAGTPFITNADHSSGNENIVLEWVTIDGNAANQSTTGGYGEANPVRLLALQNCQYVTLTDCSFQNAVQECIWGYGLTDIEIDRCWFGGWAVGNVGAINIEALSGGACSRIKIINCTVDGTISHSACIKLSGNLSHPLSEVVISGNTCKVGDASTLETLGIEFWCPSGAQGAYSHCIISGNVVTGENATNTLVFGISLGGSGGSQVAITGNTVKDCRLYSIELVSSLVTCTGNTITGSGAMTIDSNYGDQGRIVISGNVIDDPVRDNVIHIYNGSLTGSPHTIEDIIISENVIRFSGAKRAIRFQMNYAASSTVRPRVSGNLIEGDGTAGSYGITFEADDGTTYGSIVGGTIESNHVKNCQVGIYPSGSGSRYLLNRFTSVSSRYGATFASDAMVLDIDIDQHFTPQTVKVRGQAKETLRSTGDVQLPNELAAFTSDAGAAATYPNVVSWNQVNFGTELQGGIVSTNSRWAGSSTWAKTSASAYARAMFMVLGAGRMGVQFGNAANSNGANPGDWAFYVDDGAGFHLGSAYPLYLSGTGSGLTAGAGSPEGVITANPGSIRLDTSTGKVWRKASGVGNTGWSEIAGGALAGDSLAVDSASPFIRLSKLGVLKFEIDADGVITVLPHVAAPILSKAANAALEVQTAAGVSKFKVDTSAATIGVAATFSSAPILSSLTDSLPLKLNGSKVVVSEKIDLADSGDIAATGVSTGQVLSWNGAATIGLNIGTGSLDVAAGNHTHTGFALAGVSAANSVVLAKLTPGGSNGQIVWNNDGQITSVTAPT